MMPLLKTSMLRSILFMTVMVILFYSCDKEEIISTKIEKNEINILLNGIVYETGTDQPVEGVKVKLRATYPDNKQVIEDSTYTNNLGEFNFNNTFRTIAIYELITEKLDYFTTTSERFEINPKTAPNAVLNKEILIYPPAYLMVHLKNATKTYEGIKLPTKNNENGYSLIYSAESNNTIWNKDLDTNIIFECKGNSENVFNYGLYVSKNSSSAIILNTPSIFAPSRDTVYLMIEY